jgi:hypothetical protein
MSPPRPRCVGLLVYTQLRVKSLPPHAHGDRGCLKLQQLTLNSLSSQWVSHLRSVSLRNVCRSRHISGVSEPLKHAAMLSIGEPKPILSQEWFPFWEDAKKISKSTSLPHGVWVLRFWLTECVWGCRIIVIWGGRYKTQGKSLGTRGDKSSVSERITTTSGISSAHFPPHSKPFPSI